ncbi:Ribonuclease H2 subunit B [Balamuthia mandrillaris]
MKQRLLVVSLPPQDESCSMQEEQPQMCKSEDPLIISLPNPRSSRLSRYMIANGTLLELQRLKREEGSWFRDSSIISDGSLYMATPVDPLFLLLPLLEKNRKQSAENVGYYCTLEQILVEDNKVPAYQHLLRFPNLTTALSAICIVKEVSDLVLYCLNDEQVIGWLKCKMERLERELSGTMFYERVTRTLSGGSRAAHYVPRRGTDAPTSEREKGQIRMAAIGFLSEYLSAAWTTKLYQAYGLEEPAPEKGQLQKSGTTSSLSPRSKTTESGFGFGSLTNNSNNKEAAKQQTSRLTPLQKRLEKVDKRGMKTMDSFFQKKTKKAE